MAEDEKRIGRSPADYLIEIDIFDEDDPPDIDARDNLVDLLYTQDELEQLGEGDMIKGIARILDSMEFQEDNPIDVLNPRRPLEDELDLYYRPTDPRKLS